MRVDYFEHSALLYNGKFSHLWILSSSSSLISFPSLDHHSSHTGLLFALSPLSKLLPGTTNIIPTNTTPIMQASRLPYQQSAVAGKKRSADQLDSNVASDNSPVCPTTAGKSPVSKKPKLQGRLESARNSLESGKTIRQGLSNALAKKSAEMLELRQINKVQEAELKKRHFQMMALHDENDALLFEVKEAKEIHKKQVKTHKTQMREIDQENEKLKRALRTARKEVSDANAECDIIKKTATDSSRVAALHKKIEEMRSTMSKDRKVLEEIKKAADDAEKLASATLVGDARSFSARLGRRDTIIKELKDELRKHGMEVPKSKVQTGRPK